jgi:hypothetical protein
VLDQEAERGTTGSRSSSVIRFGSKNSSTTSLPLLLTTFALFLVGLFALLLPLLLFVLLSVLRVRALVLRALLALLLTLLLSLLLAFLALLLSLLLLSLLRAFAWLVCHDDASP